VSLRFPIAAAAAFAACAALASPGVSGDGAMSEDGLVVTLATDGSFLQVGRPVPVKLTIENKGKRSVELPNGALFGLGVQVHPFDSGDQIDFRVGGLQLPNNAFVLPAGGTVTATIDLAQRLSGVFAKAGRFAVVDEIAGAKSSPLELEVARDWTGFHAVVETAAGEIELEFFPDQAPRTVANFLALAERGFYDGLTFHRIVKGFMIQGGDPKGDGSGTTGRFLPFEKTGVKHERGVISMARQRDFDTASCQFFLVQKAAPFCDGNYAAFGRIVRGLDVLDQLCDTPCVMNPNGTDSGPSKPREQVLIQKVRPVAPAGAK
jgi:peptidyl-prolyl cis-trans isomerase B (cyclophilin B)